MPTELPLLLSAKVVPGAGRGKDLKKPTLNLDMQEVPAALEDGIYACRARLVFADGSMEGPFDAVMHKGPRPVFKDGPSCEVHLLNDEPKAQPASLKVGVLAYIREIRDFPSPEKLMKQMDQDVKDARAVLNNDE